MGHDIAAMEQGKMDTKLAGELAEVELEQVERRNDRSQTALE